MVCFGFMEVDLKYLKFAENFGFFKKVQKEILGSVFFFLKEKNMCKNNSEKKKN